LRTGIPERNLGRAFCCGSNVTCFSPKHYSALKAASVRPLVAVERPNLPSTRQASDGGEMKPSNSPGRRPSTPDNLACLLLGRSF